MTVVCATVADESLIARAIPKSMTLIWPQRVTITLPGLMSRCTTPASVRVLERGQDAADDVAGLGGRHRAVLDEVLQQLAVDELHHDERQLRLAAAGLEHRLLARVEDPHDRRVRHPRRGLRLLAEAHAERRVVREGGASAA